MRPQASTCRADLPMVWVMSPNAANPSPLPTVPAEAAPVEREAARRALRVRLLRDLVSHGLYRVDRDALAERLVSVLLPR